MSKINKLKLKKNRYLQMLILFLFLPISVIVVLSPGVFANPVAITYPVHWGLGTRIFYLFFVNLMLDGIILLLPLIILSKTGFEKPISKLWIFSLPLLGFWGAYIDIFYLESILSSGSVFDLQLLVIFLICLFLIFITYIITIILFLDHRLITGVLIGGIACLINGVFWILIYQQTIVFDYEMIGGLYFLGGVTFIFLFMTMLIYLTNIFLKSRGKNRLQKPSQEGTDFLFKAAIMFGQIIFLFMLSFMLVFLYG